MAATLKEIEQQRDEMRAMTNMPEAYERFRQLEKYYESLITRLEVLDAEANAAICRTADIIFITVAGACIHRRLLGILKPKISVLIIF